MIAVVDYGMGNLRSVQKGLEKVGAEAIITADPKVLVRARGIVLPGVGAFGAAVQRLEEKKLMDVLRLEIGRGKPFLGICLGLQLLFPESEESPGARGLGVIGGRVAMFRVGEKIPHMGWNQVRLKRRSLLFRGVPDNARFYFVHSYMVVPDDPAVTAGVTDYGGPFVSAVKQANVFGVQFHPEKSQTDGLTMLKNFARIARVPLMSMVYQAEKHMARRRSRLAGKD